MKIEKISDNKLKIVLSDDDMHKWNLTYETLLPDSPDTYLFFKNIIHKAKIQTGAEFENCRLTAKIIKKDKKKYIILITKNDITDFGRAANYIKAEIFIFDNIDNVKMFVKNNLYYCFLLDGKNSLFSLDGKYYLTVKTDEKLASFLFAFEDRACEYARCLETSEDLFAHLEEYGKCIIKDSALKVIYFKM